MKTMVPRKTLKGRINASFFFALADLVEKGDLRKRENYSIHAICSILMLKPRVRKFHSNSIFDDYKIEAQSLAPLICSTQLYIFFMKAGYLD